MDEFIRCPIRFEPSGSLLRLLTIHRIFIGGCLWRFSRPGSVADCLIDTPLITDSGRIRFGSGLVDTVLYMPRHVLSQSLPSAQCSSV